MMLKYSLIISLMLSGIFFYNSNLHSAACIFSKSTNSPVVCRDLYGAEKEIILQCIKEHKGTLYKNATCTSFNNEKKIKQGQTSQAQTGRTKRCLDECGEKCRKSWNKPFQANNDYLNKACHENCRNSCGN